MEHLKLPKPLLNMAATVIVCVAVMLVQILPAPGFVRVAVALPLLLFIPGYAIMGALFPDPLSIRMSFRGVLAVLLSLCIVPAVATVLDRTPWGVRPLPLVLILMALSVSAELIGWWRAQRIQSRRSHTRLNAKTQAPIEPTNARTGVQWVAAIFFLAVTATGVYWTLLAPPTTKPFTEFYIEPETAPVLSQPGQEPATIPFTVVNHENQEIEYRVEVIVDGTPDQIVGPVRVEDGGRWQTTIQVSRDTKADQRVELDLFRQGDRAPYRTIHLWIGPVE